MRAARSLAPSYSLEPRRRSAPWPWPSCGRAQWPWRSDAASETDWRELEVVGRGRGQNKLLGESTTFQNFGKKKMRWPLGGIDRARAQESESAREERGARSKRRVSQVGGCGGVGTSLGVVRGEGSVQEWGGGASWGLGLAKKKRERKAKKSDQISAGGIEPPTLRCQRCAGLVNSTV